MTTTTTSRRDGVNSGAAIKVACRVATTANITLSGYQTIDGVLPTSADSEVQRRVLVKDQTATTESGIYIMDTGTWQRAVDFDTNRDVATGTLIQVNYGTANAGSMWRLTTSGTITFGTSAITFENAAFSDSSSITFTPSGSGAVARTVQAKLRDVVSVKDFGAVGDGVTDDYTAIAAAITYAATAAGGATGATVYFPTGTYLLSAMITLPNRVALRGANGRGSVIKPHSSFAASYMFNAVNGTSSMFGSQLTDLHIDARGFNMTAVIFAQAWQETSGLNRCVVQFDGTTQYGVLIDDGFGGAAILEFNQIEIFSNSTHASSAGIRVDQISVIGGFVLVVRDSTITGSATNQLKRGIDMENDSLVFQALHCEYVDDMIEMRGVGALSGDTLTGSSSTTVDMVVLNAAFTGKVSLRNMIPNGATGLIVDNNVSGEDIPATGTGGGMLPDFTYDVSGFSAYLSAQQANVTGNGTETTILFDTEIFDRRAEYNPATGIFTAKRTGKYLLCASVKITAGTPVTTCTIKMVTSNRTYYIYRGDTDSLRDGSATITLNGSFIADMDTDDTAKVTIIASGLGADTIDVEADESFFSGHWLAR